MTRISIRRGPTLRETIKLALEDGEGRVVSDEEVTRAVNFIEKLPENDPVRMWVTTGLEQMRWNDSLGELQFKAR